MLDNRLQKSLEEEFINNDPLYNFGGWVPPVIFGDAPSPSPTPSPTASMTPTPSITPTLTPTQTGTPTPTPTPSSVVSLLLDTYGSAKVAYSVRKLSSSSTYSMTIRRDNDNATLDIGFVGENLDIDSITGFVSSNSAYVSKWWDQSGNNNDLIQADTTKQARIVNNGDIEVSLNNLPALLFDGVNDYFDLTTFFNSVSTMTESWIFNRSTAGITSIGLAQTSLANPFYSLWFSDNNIYFRPGANVGVSRIGGTLTGDFSLFGNFVSNLWTLSLNTTNYTSASYTGSGLQINAFGRRNTNYHNGLSQEYILWELDQTSNKTGIRTNQNDYFNIY